MGDKIIVENLHDGLVIRITLNAPKGNVLDAAMMTELQTALENLKDQPHVKLIQFIGEGSHFSFGASVAEHTREKAGQMLAQFHKLFYTLAKLSIPTAALVSGQCLGGGMELALMCNFIFVDSTAKLGQPEINLAVFPPPASLILPMKIGQTYADEMLLTGKIINADEAVNIGLATKSYDDKEAMLIGVDEWMVKNILFKSASSLKFGVKAGRKIFNEVISEKLDQLEKMYLDELMETNDANEGIQSFLERRKPNWKDS
jgi:cyclohexa-1,5-dienecarbonyl-CoA hydratase